MSRLLCFSNIKTESTFPSLVTFYSSKTMTPNRKWNWISVPLHVQFSVVKFKPHSPFHTSSKCVSHELKRLHRTLSSLSLKCVTPPSNVITHLQLSTQKCRSFAGEAFPARESFSISFIHMVSRSFFLFLAFLFFLHNNPNPAAYRGKSPSPLCIFPCAVEVVTMLTWLPYWNFNLNHHFRLFRQMEK